MAAAEIISAIGAGLGGAASAGSALGGIGSGIKSKKKMKYAANLQYEYGEKAAENAYQRQLALLNKTYQQESYQNRVRQLREAGLSVGLMYGGGAQGGGAGSTSGAPAGATNPSIDAGQGIEQQALANIGRGGLGLLEASRNIAQVQNVESQTKLNEQLAKKAEADAEAARANAGLLTEKKITEKQAREPMIQNLQSDLKTKNMQRIMMDVDTRIKRIEFEVAEGTKEAKIESVKYNIEKMKNDIKIGLLEIDGMELDNEIKRESKGDIIATYNAKLKNILKDTLLKDEQIKCTKEQANMFAESAYNYFMQAETIDEKLEIEYEIAELMAKAGIAQTRIGSSAHLGGSLLQMLGLITIGFAKLPGPSRPIGFGKN